jgi:hypothetical protein
VPGFADRVRRRQAPCAEVALALPAYVAGETGLDPRAAQHVVQCLRCQAEIVRYRRMLRTLHDLRDDAPRPPSTVLAEIIGTLGADDPARRQLVEATVGAGAVLWATQRRHN